MTYRELITDDAMEVNRVLRALDGTGPEMSEKAAVAILAQAIRNLQNYVAYLEGKVKKNDGHD